MASPARIEQDVKERVKAHALTDPANEVCGYVITKDGKQTTIECPNLSAEPNLYFRIHADEWEKIEDTGGEIVAVYHSHPASKPEPGEGDLIGMEKAQIPFLIYAVALDEWGYHQPTGYKAPLVGRAFIHGSQDCYSAVKDYYKEKLDIDLPDVERADLWWKNGENLYLDHFQSAGFVRVSDEDGLELHDVILVQIDSDVPNHAAVWVGDGQIFHHLPYKLSGFYPFLNDRGYMAKHRYGTFRHSSLYKS